MPGARGTQVTSKTTWKGKCGRVDVENPAPGRRPGQVHYQDAQGNKYLYDPATGQFKNAPRSVNKLLEDDEFRKGVEKGLRYLGEQ
jgi:filamentous hemagglutinin